MDMDDSQMATTDSGHGQSGTLSGQARQQEQVQTLAQRKCAMSGDMCKTRKIDISWVQEPIFWKCLETRVSTIGSMCQNCGCQRRRRRRFNTSVQRRKAYVDESALLFGPL